MPASSSDIRDWLREQGRAMPANGRLRKADKDAYYQAHPEQAGSEAPGPEYPGDDGGPESDSAASAEQAPRATRTSTRSAVSGWLGKRGGQKKGRAPREKRTMPRVPVTKLIEHTYSEIAWAAQGIPPLSRLLEAQAPIAGVVFEDTVRDTAIDRLLQPAARLEEALDATYGMLAPPLYVMAVLATAPEPGHEPALAHKSAMLGLRHSLMVMSRVSSASLERIIERAEETHEREQDVEKFMRYLFGIPEPEPQPDDERADLLSSAGIPAGAA